MEKTITTGTEITFKKTKEIFELTQTDTGFDVRQAKFSKNVQPEHWTFKELMDEFEAGNISFDGFEEADGSHVKSILISYIHQAITKSNLLINEELTATNEELTATNEELKARIQELETELLEHDEEIKAFKELKELMPDDNNSIKL